MSKFCFSVSNIESRRDGEIESDSFSDAVDELGRQIHLFLRAVTLADVVAGRVLGRAVPVAADPKLAAE